MKRLRFLVRVCYHDETDRKHNWLPMKTIVNELREFDTVDAAVAALAVMVCETLNEYRDRDPYEVEGSALDAKSKCVCSFSWSPLRDEFSTYADAEYCGMRRRGAEIIEATHNETLTKGILNGDNKVQIDRGDVVRREHNDDLETV